MAGYQRARDEEALPIYGFTCDFAKIEPPPAEMQQLFGAMQGNQAAMDDFVSVMAGTLPAPEFFAPENVGPDHGRGRRPLPSSSAACGAVRSNTTKPRIVTITRIAAGMSR